MKIALPILCIVFGFIGYIIDGIISLQYPFFTFILFLLPIAWAIGVLYDEMESRVIDNGNDHESQR